MKNNQKKPPAPKKKSPPIKTSTRGKGRPAIGTRKSIVLGEQDLKNVELIKKRFGVKGNEAIRLAIEIASRKIKPDQLSISEREALVDVIKTLTESRETLLRISGTT